MAALTTTPAPDARRATAGRHARWRRGLARAIGVAIGVHAAVLLSLRLPGDGGRPTPGPLVLVPQAAPVERPAADRGLPEPGAADEEGTRAATAARERPVTRPGDPIPSIRESPAARTETTIPATTLSELRAATLPLVASETGIGRRRLERSPEAIATARAESLLYARMAGLVVPASDPGAIGLANGGITVPIPWQGFLPDDRSDGGWRAERCSGSGDGESDKAGEAESRRAQCS